jgi:hypothetical protein
MKFPIRIAAVLVTASLFLVAAPAAHASTVNVGLVAGQNLPACFENEMPSADEGVSDLVPLGFTINFFGAQYSNVGVDTNGQLFFVTDVQEVPRLTEIDVPVIAPYGSDVTTSGDGPGTITYGSTSDGTFCAVWHNVQQYGGAIGVTNTFQVLLSTASGKPGRYSGDFDITFNYDSIEWDNAGAVNIGYTAGKRSASTLFVLDGSSSTGAASGLFVNGGSNALTTHSSGSDVPGRYIYSIVNTPPEPLDLVSSIPVIEGSTALGSTLTASAGAWGPAPVDLTYQWTRDGVSVSADPTYVVTEADLGRSLSVSVAGTKVGYKPATRTSAPVAIPLAGTEIAVPTIAGTVSIGSTLSAVVTGVAPATASVTYQWLRNGTPISGAVAPTYRLTKADARTRVSVVVAAARSGYLVASSASAPVGKIMLATPTPRIKGTAKVGKKLTVVTRKWKPAAKLKYRWYANGKSLKATGRSYTVTRSTVGKRISVRVIGSKSGWAPVTQWSKVTAKVKKR